MKKGISIKKQIEQNIDLNLKERGYPNLKELKIINRGVRNISNSINNTILKRLGKKLPDDIIKDNDGPFKITKMALLSDINPEAFEDLVVGFKSYIDQDVELKDIELISFELTDKFGETILCTVAKGYDLKRSGLYTWRKSGYKSHIFSWNNFKGFIYLFSELEKYILKHPDKVVFNLYKETLKRPNLYFGSPLDDDSILGLKSLKGIDFKDLSKPGDVIKYPEQMFNDSKNYVSITEILNTDIISFDHLFYKYRGGAPAFLDFNDRKPWTYIYDSIVEINEQQKIRSTNMINERAGYAKSFEDKKNIPEWVLDIMKSSSFLSHFGFVEYDELIDKDNVSTLEKDWLDLVSKINFPIVKDHSLRFRRLGHHKAAGLYYPHQKALCVDINTSSSFIHEYFHLIDHTQGDHNLRLSEDFKFYDLKLFYDKVVEDEVDKLPKDDAFKKQFLGKTKYNKDYFLLEEEAFARMGEIYLSINGINSHLLGAKIGTSPVYPNNEELNKKINSYFSEILVNGKSIL